MGQLACAAAREPPASAIEPDPAVAVTAPPQLFTRPFGVATTRLASSVSVKARLACAGLPAPLLIVKVSVDAAFFPTMVGENALVSAVPTTENDACPPAAGRPPPRPLTLELLFVYAPSTPEVTSTRTWQLAT